MNTPIRTRFAPSPTGFMHVGGVRTALFAWLIAKQSGGSFILRIEDTDRKRTVEGSIEHIIKTLHSLELTPDEGPKAGGSYGPYVQSERLEIYKKWAQKLYDEGKAYADPYTSEEIEAFRASAQALNRPFLYRHHRPENPPEWDGSQALRLKIDSPGTTSWHDEVRGELSAGEDSLDDFILIKADGYPTYNFAHIIDDLEMGITHVVRGEEFISSTPKYIKLYEALGIESPIFVTTPPILAPSGGKKLSKRDGAKDALEYINDGYPVPALLNFLASLGWNDGSEQEIFTIEELIETFATSKIQAKGARWDPERLNWISGHHIRAMGLDQLYGSISDTFWPEGHADFDEAYKKRVLALNQERLKYFAELPMLTHFFFAEPEYDAELLLVKGAREAAIVAPLLDGVTSECEQSDFTKADLEQRMRGLMEPLSTKPKVLFTVIRHALTGQKIAPGLFETMELLGKETVLRRLTYARSLLNE